MYVMPTSFAAIMNQTDARNLSSSPTPSIFFFFLRFKYQGRSPCLAPVHDWKIRHPAATNTLKTRQQQQHDTKSQFRLKSIARNQSQKQNRQ